MKRHSSTQGSARFVSLLLLLAVTLSTLGYFSQEARSPAVSVLGAVLLHLSGAVIAAAITTVFISFTDIRKYIVDTVIDLIADGRVVELMSDSDNEQVYERILLQRNRGSVARVESSLFNHFKCLHDWCLGSPHLHNYHVREVISRYPRRDDLLVRETHITFRAMVQHLPLAKKVLHYKYYAQIDATRSPDLDEDSYVMKFEAIVGNTVHGREKMRVERLKSDGSSCLRATFEVSAPVADEMDVYLCIHVACPAYQRNSLCYARFPTRGFEVSLTFSEAFDYQVAWLRNENPAFEGFPGADRVQRLPQGISAVMNGWVLPGEGVILSWVPKQPESVAKILDALAPPNMVRL